MKMRTLNFFLWSPLIVAGWLVVRGIDLLWTSFQSALNVFGYYIDLDGTFRRRDSMYR
jgi:hypothetical protein